jgi:hypothetical protein
MFFTAFFFLAAKCVRIVWLLASSYRRTSLQEQKPRVNQSRGMESPHGDVQTLHMEPVSPHSSTNHLPLLQVPVRMPQSNNTGSGKPQDLTRGLPGYPNHAVTSIPQIIPVIFGHYMRLRSGSRRSPSLNVTVSADEPQPLTHYQPQPPFVPGNLKNLAEHYPWFVTAER